MLLFYLCLPNDYKVDNESEEEMNEKQINTH